MREIVNICGGKSTLVGGSQHLLGVVDTNALRDTMGRVGQSLGTAGPDTGSRELGTGRGSTEARYRASVLGNDTINLRQEYTSHSF